MTSSSFAQAQERLDARRRARETAAQASLPRSTSSSFGRLPFPLSNLGRASLSTWERIKGREGTGPAFRVGQVDAELLDEELLEMLRGQIGEGLKYFGTHLKDDWSAEISLVLRAVLFKLSIWDHNATYGAALQNLRFTDARSTSSTRPPPTRWQKSIYGFVTVGGSYAWGKWNDFLLTHNEYSSPSDTSPQIAQLSRLSSIFSSTHSFLALVSFCIFLTTGRYRTLLDRILRLRLTPPTNQASRAISFEYLNRQLVWHAFTEFLLFALPLIGISRWKRWISRIWRNAKNTFSSASATSTKGVGEFYFLPERTCAICYHDQQSPLPTNTDSSLPPSTLDASGGGIIGSSATDITNPYSAVPCGCLYCYVCLAQRLEAEEGEGIICLRCGVLVKECQPWDGDVEVADEEMSEDRERKTVGFISNDEREIGELVTESDPRAKAENNTTENQEENKVGEEEEEEEGDTTAVDEDVESRDMWSKAHEGGFEVDDEDDSVGFEHRRIIEFSTPEGSDGS